MQVMIMLSSMDGQGKGQVRVGDGSGPMRVWWCYLVCVAPGWALLPGIGVDVGQGGEGAGYVGIDVDELGGSR